MKKLLAAFLLLAAFSGLALAETPSDYDDQIPSNPETVERPNVIEQDASFSDPGFFSAFSFVYGDSADPGEEKILRQSLTVDPGSEVCSTWSDWGLEGEPIYIMTQLQGPDGVENSDYEAYWCGDTSSVISRSFVAPETDGEYDYYYRWDYDDSDVSNIVSGTKDFSSETLVVGDGESTDPEPEPEPEVQMELSESPSFTVDDSDDTLTGSLEISNVGGADMSGSNIVEMQVRPAGEGPLSFVGNQDACDSDYPMNVHREYRIDAGDSESIELTSGVGLEDGKDYQVFFLTRADCYPGNDKVEPIYNSYNAGSFSFEEGTDNIPEDDDSDDDQVDNPNVVEQSKPKLSYDSESGKITTQVFFKNTGGPMQSENIVEMQVRPKGSGLLAFSDSQDTCDIDHPENVHKTFSLESGESDSTKLSTSEVSEPGEYNVYLLTRTECAPGNDEAQPYGYGEQALAGTVTIEEDRGWIDTVDRFSLPIGLAVVMVGIASIVVIIFGR